MAAGYFYTLGRFVCNELYLGDAGHSNSITHALNYTTSGSTERTSTPLKAPIMAFLLRPLHHCGGRLYFSFVICLNVIPRWMGYSHRVPRPVMNSSKQPTIICMRKNKKSVVPLLAALSRSRLHWRMQRGIPLRSAQKYVELNRGEKEPLEAERGLIVANLPLLHGDMNKSAAGARESQS